MKIRHAIQSDLNSIIQLEQENFSESEAMTSEALENHLLNLQDTFLVAEIDGQLVGYLEGPVISDRYLSDEIFFKIGDVSALKGFVAITSLSIAEEFQGQGIGTALLAAMKDIAVAKGYAGITLTCHDYLIAYYAMNGFIDEGVSSSTYGGAEWYNMVWENPAN